jgi:pimeloyl-ACP methyl ester carboxylesterase
MAESGFVEVPGARLYYEVEGSGHPLLLLHGNLGSLRMWDDQVGPLSERYQVIRYDRRGFGQSRTEHVSFSERSDAVAVLRHAQASASSCHLIGQSMGGIVALDLTIERPQMVDSLVLVAAGAGGYRAELPDGVQPPPFGEMERALEAKDWDRLAELETEVWVDGWGQPPTRIDPALRTRVHDWILTTYREENEEGDPQRLDPPANARLAEVRVPTLVLVGTADEPGGVLNGRHVAQVVQGAQLEEFDAAHMIQLEQPDRFNRVVLDFLAGVEGRHARDT